MELVTMLLIVMLSMALAVAGARGMLALTFTVMSRRRHAGGDWTRQPPDGRGES